MGKKLEQFLKEVGMQADNVYPPSLPHSEDFKEWLRDKLISAYLIGAIETGRDPAELLTHKNE